MSKIFAAKELRELGETLKVGFGEENIFFKIGPASIWLKQVEGKFPKLDQFFNQNDRLTWLTIDPSDAAFVAERLENLPGRTERETPVYFELGEHVTVRGNDSIQKIATEIRLSKSRYVGEGTVYPMNRFFLKTALECGVNRIGFHPKERSPLIGYGDAKTFVWMPLEGTEPQSEKLTVLNSNEKTTPAKKVEKPVVKEKVPVLAVAENAIRPEPTNTIQAAESLCATLYETLQSTRRLVKHLKQQRKQDRIVRSTLESLKQLQGL